MPSRARVAETARAEAINPATANTQYGHWKRAVHPGVSVNRSVSVSHPPPKVAHDWLSLLTSGFAYGADWRLDTQGLPGLDVPAPAKPGLYAFILEDQVVYIGVTARTLARRMDDYRRGHAAQRTSSRIHRLLCAKLKEGAVLRALFASPEPDEWKGFPVNVAVGLEPELIRLFQPKWNKQGLGRAHCDSLLILSQFSGGWPARRRGLYRGADLTEAP